MEAQQAETGATAGKQQKRKKVMVTGFTALLLFMLAFTIFFKQSFETIEVSGDSMLPSLEPGDRLLISKAYWLVGDIQHKDIVVINNEETGEVIIKRVYYLAGEEVDLMVAPFGINYDLTEGPYVVPDGYVYVIGDNIYQSEDSRKFGPFPVEWIRGKVVSPKFGLPPADSE